MCSTSVPVRASAAARSCSSGRRRSCIEAPALAHRRLSRRAQARRSSSSAASVDAPINGARIELLGAREHNLKGIDVAIPLNRLVCITGVSGSGKSTLVQDVLHAALLRAKGKPTEAPGAHRALRGTELIDDVVLVDQTPIGRTTRSNPASYVGAFDAIRKRFAGAPLAKERGYTQGTFSFNAGTGRCPTCGGNGFEHVEMQFLSDVYLRCPDCDGKRYRAEVLEVTLEEPVDRRRARDDGRARRAHSSPATPTSTRRCSRSPRWGSTTCGSASRCRRSRAAKRSG